MAKATITYAHPLPIFGTPEPTVTLAMSGEEAKALQNILMLVGGDPDTSRRKFVDSIAFALAQSSPANLGVLASINAPDLTGRINFTDPNEAKTPEPSKKYIVEYRKAGSSQWNRSGENSTSGVFDSFVQALDAAAEKQKQRFNLTYRVRPLDEPKPEPKKRYVIEVFTPFGQGEARWKRSASVNHIFDDYTSAVFAAGAAERRSPMGLKYRTVEYTGV